MKEQEKNKQGIIMTTKVIAFGDSIMKGIVVDKARSIADSLKYMVSMESFSERCRHRLGIEVTNMGKFGSTVTHGVAALDRYASHVAQADYTLLEYGGNDCDFRWEEIGENPEGQHLPKTSLADFIAQYDSLLAKVREAGSRPVMLSLPPLASERYFNFFTRKLSEQSRRNILGWLGGSVEAINNWHEMYNLEVFKLAIARRVPIIDITSAFLTRRDYMEYLCDDGIHPNEKGHQLIADVVCDYVMKHIDEVNAVTGMRAAAV